MARRPAAGFGCQTEGSGWVCVLEAGGTRFPGVTREDDGEGDTIKPWFASTIPSGSTLVLQSTRRDVKADFKNRRLSGDHVTFGITAHSYGKTSLVCQVNTLPAVQGFTGKSKETGCGLA